MLRMCVMNLVLVCAPMAVIGCDSSVDSAPIERREARALLRQISAIDAFSPAESRRPLVEALGSSSFQSESILQVRDLCFHAHDALVSAELAQSSVRAVLDPIEAAGAAVPADAQRRLERSLQESSTNFETARRLLPQCQDRVRELADRFRRRTSERGSHD